MVCIPVFEAAEVVTVSGKKVIEHDDPGFVLFLMGETLGIPDERTERTAIHSPPLIRGLWKYESRTSFHGATGHDAMLGFASLTLRPKGETWATDLLRNFSVLPRGYSPSLSFCRGQALSTSCSLIAGWLPELGKLWADSALRKHRTATWGSAQWTHPSGSRILFANNTGGSTQQEQTHEESFPPECHSSRPSRP